MNTIVTGTRGEGKSTLSLWLAKQWSQTVVIFDPRGTFEGKGIEVDNTYDLLEHIYSQDYLDGESPAPLILNEDAPVADVFGNAIRALFPAKFRGSEGRIAIVVDEARQLQSPHTIDEQLDRLIRQAPIQRVLTVQNTHQLMDWNSATKSVMDEVYLFRQVGPRNRVVAEEHFGPEVAEIVERLPRHHCVRCWFARKSDDDQMFEVWDNPERWAA